VYKKHRDAGMEKLRQRVMAEGVHLGNGILKVDAFLNHHLDTELIFEVGIELAHSFLRVGVTKVLTVETSGIAPGLVAAHALGVPLLYARKRRPITMTDSFYVAEAPSHTKLEDVSLMVSAEFLCPEDRVLLVDDFLATGATMQALSSLIRDARATLLGIAVVIEKEFEKGREALRSLDVPIISLAVIRKMRGTEIVLAQDPSGAI